MSLVVSFTPAARIEIMEAFDWYEGRANGLGAAFQAEIDRQVECIRTDAGQFPAILADVRRARLRRFPYSLFFRIDDNTAFVIACFHASRDPKQWESRV